ncbi:MAG TPA: family 43 glycosylhydrolase [Prolixibacteraceae bacterium]|nr:family 43 glycosylhydrolase [Prolixibacteraceae bacterium]
MGNKLFVLVLFCSFLFPFPGFTESGLKDQGNGNPLVPGYFADPTIKKFGNTFYLYATTDGVKLASGQPTVWISKDFVNWYNYELDIKVPDGLTNCWAPDVIHTADGKYIYLMGNCEFGCNIYGYVSGSPMGPWTPVNNGEPIIPVGTGKKDLPALDAQFLVDDDGAVYAYFGTWCTSFGGVGWAKLNPQCWTVEKQGFIPIAELPKAFEACYPMKRNGKYILMYSSGDCRLSSYAVHYAWADTPTGSFHYGANNPVLSSNADGTVDSPGHHSVIEVDGQYYIIYHRHDNPHSSGGMFRQVCADKLVFANDTTIEKVIPTHTGIGLLGKDQVPYKNLALGVKASASSFYKMKAEPNHFSPKGIDYEYTPSLAVDDNNGTLWKASSGRLPQSLVIDLGKTVEVKRIETQFEHAEFYYQYKLEISTDSIHWQLFADRTDNRRSGSPMIDDHNLPARFIRLSITGTEKPGLYAAVWNIKVYDSLFDVPSFQNKEVTNETDNVRSESRLVNLNVAKRKVGTTLRGAKNKGTLGGTFESIGNPVVVSVNQVKAIQFDGNSELKLSVKAPSSLEWNSAFTASAWVLNPEIGDGECLMVWNSRDNMLMGSYAAMGYGKENYGAVAHGDGYIDIPFRKLPEAGKWHHLAVSFDGMIENIYVDGKLDSQLPLNLFVQNDTIRIGASGEPSENFSGYIANIQLFDYSMDAAGIEKLLKETQPGALNKK